MISDPIPEWENNVPNMKFLTPPCSNNFRSPHVPDKPHRSDDEVQHTIRGAITGPAVAVPAVAHVVAQLEHQRKPMLHLFFRGQTKAPVPATTRTRARNSGRAGKPNFSEPKLQMTPAQVHDDSSHCGLPAQGSESRLTDENVPCPSIDSSRKGTRSRNLTKSLAIESRAKLQPSRIRFDNFDNFRQIPNQIQLTEGVYYAYLAQKMEKPSTGAQQHDHLKAIARLTRQQLSQSKIQLPQSG